MEKELQKASLRASSLGVDFHVRDLVGLGTATRTSSAAGTVIRLR